MHILVIEDDPVLRKAVTDLLSEEEYFVDQASAGDEGFYLAQQDIYDLIILDVMLPEMSGIEIVKKLRMTGCAVPILLLTAKDSVDDRVTGLEAGADDYLVKPFAVRELLARMKALERRKGNMAMNNQLYYGELLLNRKAHDGFAGKVPLGLGLKEYDILEFLLLNKEQVLTREQIFDRVWGYDSDAAISIVDLYIHYLRKKLMPYGLDSLIQTVRGTGFILREPS
jgi:DNA-binding response OmpR family regulator